MSDTFRVRQLLIKAHFDELTSSERDELDKLLLTEEGSLQIQDEINSISKEEVISMLKGLNVDKGWKQVIKKETERRSARLHRRRNVLIATAAAASILLAGIFVYWPAKQKALDPLYAAGALFNTSSLDQAVLQLANGKRVALNDSGQQTFTVGNAQLFNVNRVLKLASIVNDPGNDARGWNTIIVPSRLDYKIELPDGSIVWLNSTTKFRFPLRFDENNREVHIEEGEAYFQVARQSAAPFTVHIGETSIQVLGTEFNINAYKKEQVITSLVNGKVAVTSNGMRRELMPNQQAIVSYGRADMKIQGFDASITTSWRQGIHYFKDATINEIAVMLSRWFNIKLIIDNPMVAEVQFRGRLDRNRPISEFVEEMNLTKDASFYWKEGVLHCK